MIESVLVTGGGSGIGAALALELACRGRKVLVTGRRTNELAAVAAQSEHIDALSGDVTDPSHQAALADALAALPGPRAVFHGAGYFQTGFLDRLSADEWHRSLAVNVEARWALSCRCATALEGGGRVLFIGSDAGANPRVGGTAYSIAQSASETLRRALQAEWADRERPIQVAGFKPGLVDTDMVRGFMALPANEFPARAAYEEYINEGRLSTPDVVAKFATWLLLDVDDAAFTTTAWDIRDAAHHRAWRS